MPKQSSKSSKNNKFMPYQYWCRSTNCNRAFKTERAWQAHYYGYCSLTTEETTKQEIKSNHFNYLGINPNDANTPDSDDSIDCFYPPSDNEDLSFSQEACNIVHSPSHEKQH